MTARRSGLRVGDVARRTGLTVRTLHYYEELGLLAPARRSASGYRLYDADDLERLLRIASLRQLGFSLEEIRGCLGDPVYSLPRVVELHLTRLREQMAAQAALLDRLESLASHLRTTEEVSVEELLNGLETIAMVERYYTKEQQEELATRRAALGETGMQQAQADWQALIDAVRAEMAAGTDPTDPRAQELARRWQNLVVAFTGGSPEIAGSLQRMWSEEQAIHGHDTAEMRALGAYIEKASAAVP